MSDMRTPAPDWDPRAEQALENQQQAYDEMRERCPVARSDYFGWSVFRYDDVVALSRDPEIFGNGPGTIEEIEKVFAAGGRLGIPLNIDPPAHTTYRMMMNPYFAPAKMKAFEPRSREIASRLIEPLIGAGAADLVEAYTDPYPVQSLCALLGWDADDWRQIKQWTTDSERGVVRRDQPLIDRVDREWSQYILDVVALRRSEPKEDVTSWLLEQEKEGRPLPDKFLVSILRLLLHAGHGTTTASIGICLYHLAKDQTLQQRLRSEPQLIAQACEEILRVDGPLAAMPRTAKKDVEIRGRKICAGERIQMMYLSADRDPEAFPDADTLNIERKPNRHLIWGTGIHTCLGMPLAKLELRVALEEVLTRTKSFTLNPKAKLRRLRYPGNGFRALPITFEAA